MTALTDNINKVIRLTTDEKAVVEKAFVSQEISKDDLWIKQGRICDHVAFVVSVSAQTGEKESKYSLETDILWPYLVQATRTHFVVKLWQKGQLRGDVYAGLNIDFPRGRETEGRFADYSLASGYRQYFWKGLNLEFSQTTGLGVLQNHVTTGKTYNSFDWLVTGYIGYKFEFARRKLYVLPQFGVASVLYKSNPWPIYEDNTLTKEVGEAPFLLGSLRFGYSF